MSVFAVLNVRANRPTYFYFVGTIRCGNTPEEWRREIRKNFDIPRVAIKDEVEALLRGQPVEFKDAVF